MLNLQYIYCFNKGLLLSVAFSFSGEVEAEVDEALVREDKEETTVLSLLGIEDLTVAVLLTGSLLDL